MELVTVDGKSYYEAKDVAKLWGYKVNTIERYAAPSSGKIKGCIRSDGGLLVPVDAIKPIDKPTAQAIVWGLIQVKNEPESFLDLTQYGISNQQLSAVLDEMERQLYIDFSETAYPDVRSRLLGLRLTSKAFDLVQYKRRYSKSPLQGVITYEKVGVIFSAAQTLLQLKQQLVDRALLTPTCSEIDGFSTGLPHVGTIFGKTSRCWSVMPCCVGDCGESCNVCNCFAWSGDGVANI